VKSPAQQADVGWWVDVDQHADLAAGRYLVVAVDDAAFDACRLAVRCGLGSGWGRDDPPAVLADRVLDDDRPLDGWWARDAWVTAAYPPEAP
jgi:hypothetical protein